MADSEGQGTEFKSVTQLVPHQGSAGGREEAAKMEAKDGPEAGRKSPKPSMLSRSGSKSLISDMVVALPEPSTPAIEHLSPVVSQPPRKGTPIPFQDARTSQLLATPSSSSDLLYLGIPLPTTPDPASSTSLSGAQDLKFDETPTSGLAKAYSTVLASTNIPIGHQSAGSLRHVVLSRTTSSSAVSSVNASGNMNSSQDSFVHVSDIDFNPVIKHHDDIETSTESDKPAQESRAVVGSGDQNPVESDATERQFATVKPAPIKPRSKVANAILKSSSILETNKRSSTDISHCQEDLDPESPWVPSLPHSPQVSGHETSEDLAQSYDSAQDPNNLKSWWEAGVRDGDPVGTPQSRPLSSFESSVAASADLEQQRLPDMSFANSKEGSDPLIDTSAQAPDKSSNQSRSTCTGAVKPVESEDVELGRELQTSLSDMLPRNKEFWGMAGSMQVVVEDDDHYNSKSVTNSCSIRMKSEEPLIHSEFDLDLPVR